MSRRSPPGPPDGFTSRRGAALAILTRLARDGWELWFDEFGDLLGHDPADLSEPVRLDDWPLGAELRLLVTDLPNLAEPSPTPH